MDWHPCPVLIIEPRKIAVVARSTSALSKTMAGSLPPNSRKAGMKFRAACSPTLRPVVTLPVKHTASTWSPIAEPVSLAPSTIVRTASSSGTSDIIWRKGSAKRGVTSLGLIITAHPANNAGIASMSAKVSGKFHGLIIPTKGKGRFSMLYVMNGNGVERPSLGAFSISAVFIHRLMLAATPAVSIIDRP